MQKSLGKVSPAVFGAILFSFFLAFFSVSCQGQKIMTLTGLQLVTGTTVQQPEMMGPAKAKRVGGEPLAVAAFVCALVGLALSFVKGPRQTVIRAVLGAIGAFALLLLKWKLDNQILKQGEGMLHAEYETGFWLALFLYFAATVLNAVAFAKRAMEGGQQPG